ncbi:MAG TPA: aa3-type cytochrome c oxidase subunit IV [Caulobacteraceae bacterium]
MAEDLVSLGNSSEIAAHTAAYHSFALGVKWVIVVAAAMISFLGVWFAAGAGFFAGLIVGLIVFAAGTFALRHGWAHSSEESSLSYPPTA